MEVQQMKVSGLWRKVVAQAANLKWMRKFLQWKWRMAAVS